MELSGAVILVDADVGIVTTAKVRKEAFVKKRKLGLKKVTLSDLDALAAGYTQPTVGLSNCYTCNNGTCPTQYISCPTGCCGSGDGCGGGGSGASCGPNYTCGYTFCSPCGGGGYSANYQYSCNQKKAC